MPLISLCGFSGAGKDTTASILINKYGYEKLSFASSLKDILSIIFGWNRNMLEGITNEDRIKRLEIDNWWVDNLGMDNISPREMMKRIGTELFRNNFHEDIWLKIVERKIQSGEKFVVTDCRFPNEIKMLQKYGNKLIFIDRNKPCWFDLYKAGVDCNQANELHESERLWIREDFDCIIDNNGTLTDLEEGIDIFISQYENK